MASQDNEQQKPLFPTPNPQELKEQSGKDTIAKRYSGQDEDLDDMDVNNADSDSATVDEAESRLKEEDLDDMDVNQAASYSQDEET